MPSVLQKVTKSEPLPPAKLPKSTMPRKKSIKALSRPRKPRKRRGDATVPIAATAGALTGAASIPRVEKRMGTRTDAKKLRSKIKPGDIILTGRRTTYANVPKEMRTKLRDKIFWRGLKPASGAYTPHGVLAIGTGSAKKGYKRYTKNIIHQGEEVYAQKLTEELKESDRFVVLRPKKKTSRKDLGKVFGYAKRKKGATYGELSAAAQGAGGIVVPKKIRDLCTRKKGKMFCTSFPARAYEQAGAPVVSGKARTALAKDLLSSKKLKSIGWAGAKISRIERLQVEALPRIIRGAAWAGAAGAAAYGAKKIYDKYKGKKK